jgi:serine/threonine protein kinase
METIASRYRLEEKIGMGGEARVFRACDLVTGGDVAVRLSPRNDSPATDREIPAGHRGWVQLLDRGVDSAQGAYAIFELLQGETLGAPTASSDCRAKSSHTSCASGPRAVRAPRVSPWSNSKIA